MTDRPGGETTRLAFGCITMVILAAVMIGLFSVVFIWDVNVR